MKYQPTIGLEIHVQLATSSKMFCSCPNVASRQVQPNTYICPVCLGYPGTLPLWNREALEAGLRVALALEAKINSPIEFSRKNYFYPDLPKGYQISQHRLPLGEGGFFIVDFLSEDKRSKKEFKVNFAGVHLEEDTAKMVHERNATLLDFNRAGVPLVEIVTCPDIHSPREARLFAQRLQELLRILGVSNADMELGQMRIDANVSVASAGQSGQNGRVRKAGGKKQKIESLGTKVEIKNINSFVSLEKALTYEIGRQIRELSAGRKIFQETRGWDARKGESLPQRSKEFSADYRYFPEPDLPPVEFDKKHLEKIKKSLPVLPRLTRQKALSRLPRAGKIYSLSDIGQLNTFLELSRPVKNLDLLASWLLLPEAQKLSLDSHLFLFRKNWGINEMQLWARSYLKYKNSARADKEVKLLMTEHKKMASNLEPLVEKIIKDYPDVVAAFIQGREQALKFLAGQVMKEIGGKGDAGLVEKMLRKRIR